MPISKSTTPSNGPQSQETQDNKRKFLKTTEKPSENSVEKGFSKTIEKPSATTSALPSADSNNTLATALSLEACGIAVIWLHPASKVPINNEWSTAPVASAEGLRATYRAGDNLGVRCGYWSQPADDHGLLVIDLDVRDPTYIEEATVALEGLLPDSLEVPIVLSGGGNGSRHLWFACPLDDLPPKANTTIAKGPAPSHKTWKIEVLSTGKQVVAPPSVHPDAGKRYIWLVPWESPLPIVPAPVLNAVHMALETQSASALHTPYAPRSPRSIGRPGDDFNRRADWQTILEPHGWRTVRCVGEVTYWRRPDKTKGVSATTGYGGTNLLYIFTSSAPPFEPDTAYSPFGAYALLEHDGDFQRAAKVLHNRGYGTQYEHGRRVTRVNTTRPATRQRVVGKRR